MVQVSEQSDQQFFVEDLCHVFAKFTADLTYDALTPDARERVCQSILDTYGVSLAASGLEPAVSIAHEIVMETGGTGQATLWAYGGRSSAVMAAFGNGALVHGLDYDDLTPWGQHVGSTIIPTVFALAERQGGVHGRDIIAAIAAGQDIFARLLRFTGWKKDWNFSTAMGVFAGAAAGAKILGLDSTGIANAMGIATLESGGVMEMVAGRGSNLRGVYAGFSAKGATLAALLAERGLSGIEKTFEGPNGVFQCYFGGEYDRDAILHGLGQKFLGAQTLYKRWPCVGTAHSHMKAAIDIVTDNDLMSKDIAEVTLFVGDYHQMMSEPLVDRIAPKTMADAKFSLPYLVSVAIKNRAMTVQDFTQHALQHPDVLSLGQKMKIVPDATLDWKRELPPGRVEIVAKDGRRWRQEGNQVPGNADNPLDWSQIREKFRECVAVSVNPPTPDQVARVEQMAMTLHQLDDATALFRVF